MANSYQLRATPTFRNGKINDRHSVSSTSVQVQKTLAPITSYTNPCASRFGNAQLSSEYGMPSTSSSVRSTHSHASARPVVGSHRLKSADSGNPNVLKEAADEVSSIRPGFGESNRQSSKSIVPSNGKSQETSLAWKPSYPIQQKANLSLFLSTILTPQCLETSARPTWQSRRAVLRICCTLALRAA